MIKRIALAGLLSISALQADKNHINISQFTNLPFLQNGNRIEKVKDLGNIYQLNVKINTRNGIQFADVFVTKDKKYFIFGKGFTNKGKPLQFPIDMNKYKKFAAFKIGKGKDEYFVFTDPECPFCKRFEKQIPELSKKATFYFYLFPLSFHKHSKAMSLYILSLPKEKRAEALHNLQIKNDNKYQNAKFSYKESQKANQLLQKQEQIANELGVRGTPTIFDKNKKSINWTILGNKYHIQFPIDMKGVEYLQKQDAEIVLGKGNKDIYLFIDPNCKHCQKIFTKAMNKLKNKYKIHIFLYASNQNYSKEKVAYILSLPKEKRAKALEDIMIKGKLSQKQLNKAKYLITNKNSKIFKYITSIQYIAQKMRINNFPTICDKTGKVITKRIKNEI